jgi:hypothetical protein
MARNIVYRNARIRPAYRTSTKRPHGKPPHEPTDLSRSQVATMMLAGDTQPKIAAVLGISEPTLRKYYREEIDATLSRANANVAQNMYNMARGKGAQAYQAAAFWLTHRAGWKRPATEVTGADGGAIQINVIKEDLAL